MSILPFLLFPLTLFISFYIPGIVIINPIEKKLTALQHLILSLITGCAAFLLVSYTVAFFQLPQLTFVFLIVCFLISCKIYFHTIVQLLSKKKKIKITIDYWIGIILLLGSVSFLAIMFFSGFPNAYGMKFIGINEIDGIIHLAYIKNQALHFLPQHPMLAEIPLRGYHFFYDFLLSRFALFYGFNAEDLYFRFFTFFISLLYGGSILLISQALTKNKIALRIIVFLAYFSHGTMSVLLLLQNNTNYLGISQPILLILDPSMVLGIALLITAMSIIPQIKERLFFAVITGIILGVLAQIKVYTGIIGIFTLVLYTIYILVKYKGKHVLHYFFAITITGLLTFFTFQINNGGSGSLIFAPLLFYQEYMRQPFLNALHWQQRKEIYDQYHNVPRQMQVLIEAIFFVWILNLGSRLILLTQINKLFRKTFWKDERSVLLFLATTVSIVIPSFFIQSHSVFNSVQFLWVTLVLLCIPAGIIWSKLFQKNILARVFVLLFIGLFSLIGTWYMQSMFFLRTDFLMIKPYQLQLYKYFADTVPPNSYIVLLPEVRITEKGAEIYYHKQPIIAAMTGRNVYYESELTPYVEPSIITQRKKNVETLFFATERCDEKEIISLLHKIGSHYIISDKKNNCLGSSRIKGVKVEAQGVNFYDIDVD